MSTPPLRPVELVAFDHAGVADPDLARGRGGGYLELHPEHLEEIATYAEILDQHGFDRTFAADLRAGRTIEGPRARQARATFASHEDDWYNWTGGSAMRLSGLDVERIGSYQDGLLMSLSLFLEFLGEAPDGFRVIR
jgi:hypothetical protein